MFAAKFATGSSVSKNPQGEEEIVVQGDVGDDIVSLSESRRTERGEARRGVGASVARWAVGAKVGRGEGDGRAGDRRGAA